MPTGLADLEEDRVDAGVFRRTCNVWTVGPLSVEACYELEPPTVTVTVTLFGVDIGWPTPSPSGPATPRYRSTTTVTKAEASAGASNDLGNVERESG